MSSERQSETGKSYGAAEGPGSAADSRESEIRVVEIKNVVLVASIIAFVAISALFVKCVQR